MNFLRYRFLYLGLSGILVLGSILAMIGWGLKPAVDFTGGSLLEYRFENRPSTEEIKKVVENQAGAEVASVQSAGENLVIIKTSVLSPDQASKIASSLGEKFAQKVSQERFESIGPVLGKELLQKTTLAVILTAGFILLYVGWTFKNMQYGVSAILAMFHDSMILLGSFAVLGHYSGVEVDTLFVTAVLTTLSFSVHDTVVVYDRIREARRQYPKVEFQEIANKAITETMGRSLNNSLTIIFMLTALWLLGGSTIQWFVVALLIGTITGTYSSPFVAVPLLLVWEKWVNRRGKKPGY